MNYMRQQITDLILRVCFIVLGFNVIFMLALTEIQYYNGVNYEHSTTESVAGKLPLCYNREMETHTVKVYICCKVQHCTEVHC